MINNLPKWAVVKSGLVAGRQFAIQEIEYFGKPANCLMVFPYGIHANLPADDTQVALLSMGGHNENKAGLGWTPKLFPDDLEEGEVTFYHPLKDTIIKLKNNGDIDITGTNVNITATKVSLTGDLEVTGEIKGGTVTDGTIDLAGHTHVGSATAPDGPVSDTGAAQ